VTIIVLHKEKFNNDIKYETTIELGKILLKYCDDEFLLSVCASTTITNFMHDSES